MKNMYKTLFILLIPTIMFANNYDGKYTKTKTVKKEFTVNKDALLNVSNKYGNIEIVTWNENRIVFEIVITTNGDNEDKVSERLDDITIDFSNSISNVSAKTIIEKSNNWNWIGKSNNINLKINYSIKVPATNHVDITNDYGNILIDKLEGSSKINCDYGKLIIGSLFHKSNSININYAPLSTISYVNEAKINADYSKLVIDKSNAISLNSDYSNSTFEQVDYLEFNGDYGNITVEKVKIIKGNSDYLVVKIGTLSDKLILNTDYGAVKINELKSGFSLVDLKSSYTGIKIGIDKLTSFNLNATYSYGDLKHDDLNFTFNKKVQEKTSKNYEGYLNNNNSKSLIKINSTYGSSTFYSN